MTRTNSPFEILLLVVLVLLTGCASTTVRAPWRSYPGALVPNACNRYALASCEDLLCRGIPAYYVVYSWSSGGNIGRHAVTIFQDGDAYFLVDNAGSWPMRVRGKTVMELVKSYDRSAYVVWEASDLPLPIDGF